MKVLDTLARKVRTRRRGTALIVVMMLVLFFSATTLVLLGSTQTSMAQSEGNRAKTQANAIMDAGVQWSLLQIHTGTLGVGDSSATPLSFGDGAFTYAIGEPTPNPAGKYRTLEVTGQVQTGVDGSGAPRYTTSRVNVTVEVVPQDVGLPGALTVDSTNGMDGGTLDGANLVVDFNGKPGTISGQDINDVTLVAESPSNVVAGVAITSLETELNTDPAGTLVNATKANFSKATLYGSPVVDQTATPPAPSILAAIKAKSRTTTNVITTSGNASPPGGYGTPSAPTLIFINLPDGASGVKFAGIGDGYGVVYVTCDNPDLSGNNSALFTLSGGSRWHGLIYVETGEAEASGTNSAVFAIDGTAKVLGGVIIGAMNEWNYSDDSAAYPIAQISGGGTGNNLVYSTSGLKYASSALEQNGDVVIRSYQVVTGLGS